MEKLVKIISLMLENKEVKINSEFTDSTDLRNDLGFDSLDLAELTVRIEKDFGVDVFVDGIVTTIGEIKKKLSLWFFTKTKILLEVMMI